MPASPGKLVAAPAEKAGGKEGAGGDKSLPDPTKPAKRTLLLLLLGAAVIAFILEAFGWNTHAFKPAQDATANFALFAGFYVAAQVIERLLEVASPLLPPWDLPGADDAAKAAHAKADRGALALGITTLAGVIASAAFGLYFLTAVGIGVGVDAEGNQTTLPLAIDMIVTGLTIGAGTKPLHDLITNIQNKNSPETGTKVV